MLDICAKLNLKQFINFSSVHAGNRDDKFKSDDAILPNNLWFITLIRENI